MTFSQRIVAEVGRLLNNTSNPQHGAIGHLATAAGRGVESLVYLADIDERRFGGEWPIDAYENDCIDDAHVRWAATSALSCLDLCIAAAGRLSGFAIRPPNGEDSIRSFYQVDYETGTIRKDKRDIVIAPWRAWIDSVVADHRYADLLRVRNALVHADAFRIVHGTTETIAGHEMRYGYRVKSMDPSAQGSSCLTMNARAIVKLSRDIALEQVEKFIIALRTLS
jgi:hypothetical protein